MNSQHIQGPAWFSRRLLQWARANGRRHLPWQRRRTPYRVWVSEIMLQQTRVESVMDYYRRFMHRFPSLRALARAPLDDVLHHWAGLGYYARARNLHRAARHIVARHGGRFPRALDEVMALPGIGRSTAGAILSLACDQRHAILDGNVKRVLCRCFGIEGWPGAPAVERELWRLADSLTPTQQVAAHNQAIMDLGSTVCTRARPRCLVCPMKSKCVAHLQGLTEGLPVPRPKRSQPVRRTCMLLLRDHRDAILLERRPPVGIWGGLWSLPECEDHRQASHWCARQLRCEARLEASWQPLRHSFSHYHLDITPLLLRLENGNPRVADHDDRRWCDRDEVAGLGMAAPVKKLIERFYQDQRETP